MILGCTGCWPAGCTGRWAQLLLRQVQRTHSRRLEAGIGQPHARRRLAAGYMAIARLTNRLPETDLEGIEHRDRNDLAAATADLRDAAATERSVLTGSPWPRGSLRLPRRLPASW